MDNHGQGVTSLCAAMIEEEACWIALS